MRKRENFRAAFNQFDPPMVASYDEADVRRLLGDAGIVRHRGKIESVINNSRRYAELTADFGSLDAFVWNFAVEHPEGDRSAPHGIPSSTPSSLRLSKELKHRGWTFVGATTMYAFMQSVGIVNDHVEGCFTR